MTATYLICRPYRVPGMTESRVKIDSGMLVESSTYHVICIADAVRALLTAGKQQQPRRFNTSAGQNIIFCTDSFFKAARRQEYYQGILMYYMCDIIGGELSCAFADEDEQEYMGMPEWIPIEELGNIRIYTSLKSTENIVKILQEKYS